MAKHKKVEKDARVPESKASAKEIAEALLDSQSLVAELTSALESSGAYYVSKSKGPVKLQDMHVQHLWNAYVNRYKNWLDTLGSIEDPSVRITAMLVGPADPALKALSKELSDRVSNEVNVDVAKARKSVNKKTASKRKK